MNGRKAIERWKETREGGASNRGIGCRAARTGAGKNGAVVDDNTSARGGGLSRDMCSD